MVYRMMYLAAEGYLWEKLDQSSLDPDEMERDFMKMAEFWRDLALRRKGADEK